MFTPLVLLSAVVFTASAGDLAPGCYLAPAGGSCPSGTVNYNGTCCQITSSPSYGGVGYTACSGTAGSVDSYNGKCPDRFVAKDGYCCPAFEPCPGNQGRAPDYGCLWGSVLVDGYCCPMWPRAPCPGDIGPVVGGKCPNEYIVNSGYCCPKLVKNICTGSKGPSASGKCSTGYSADINDNCCPGNSTKPCNMGYMAYDGLTCNAKYILKNGYCCPTVEPPCENAVGYVNNGQCSDGYIVVGDFCCPPKVWPPCVGNAGPAVGNSCTTGYHVENGYCCPGKKPSDCTGGIGPAVDYKCPAGFISNSGYCCPAPPTATRCALWRPLSYDGGCYDNNFTVKNGYCCPKVEPPCAGAYGPSTLGRCNWGTVLIQGYCCPQYKPGACVGTTGLAVGGACPSGYSVIDEYCCPNPPIPAVCNGTTGPAVSGTCPSGYSVINGYCCPSSVTSTSTPMTRCSGTTGPAINNMCAAGYYVASDNYCCPTTAGTTLVPPTSSCPNGAQAIGPTSAGLCPSGSMAVNDICCPSPCIDVAPFCDAVPELCLTTDPGMLSFANENCKKTCNLCSAPIPAVCNGTAGPVPANGNCSYGFMAVKGQCCPATELPPLCGGDTDLIAGQCARGYYKYNMFNADRCCPAICNGDAGPPVNGTCPVGYDKLNYDVWGWRCCPSVNGLCYVDIGRAVEPDMKCPIGFFMNWVGQCCQIPVYDCQNPASSTMNCNTITVAMCNDTKLQSQITENCPNKCGFCPYTGGPRTPPCPYGGEPTGRDVNLGCPAGRFLSNNTCCPNPPAQG